jgi:hypothetical protein
MRRTCLLALLALAGCGKSDNAPGPGGVTVGEARALDEAAEMIEKRQLPAEALRSPAPAPAPAPAPSIAATASTAP